MKTQYRQSVIEQLCEQQSRFAPRQRKIEQVARAERLLSELSQEKSYSYEYLSFRITDYRSDACPHVVVSGEDAAHDIQLFIEDLSDAANVNVDEAGQPVLTVEELSRKFHVSTKTISRWRRQGLVSRRFLFGSRKRVGFLESSVEQFVANNHDKVRRGERFSQLTDEERDDIIDRARRLSQVGGCPADVIRRIAGRVNRSVETIRYTLKQFDQRHPKMAIFPEQTGPLTDESKHLIYQQYRRGTAVDSLAKRHCRTKANIYRVINEMRAKRIQELPLEYMPNEIFDKPGIKKVILAETPEPEQSQRLPRTPSGLPSYLNALYEVPLLTREQEQHVFRKFNYYKHLASKMRDALVPANARTSDMDRIESLYNEAVKTKNEIVRANLRLVVSIAKRHVSGSEDFFELVSDGNMSLIRAVEKFDFSRGNKFSTYASWAIMKNFARTIPDAYKQRDRFRTSFDEMFESTQDSRSDRYEQESAQQVRQQQIGRILSHLDDREQKIIISRFGLGQGEEPQTLKEVGGSLGVTKERIRQIEARALNKLRIVARAEKIDLPD